MNTKAIDLKRALPWFLGLGLSGAYLLLYRFILWPWEALTYIQIFRGVTLLLAVPLLAFCLCGLAVQLCPLRLEKPLDPALKRGAQFIGLGILAIYVLCLLLWLFNVDHQGLIFFNRFPLIFGLSGLLLAPHGQRD